MLMVFNFEFPTQIKLQSRFPCRFVFYVNGVQFEFGYCFGGGVNRMQFLLFLYFFQTNHKVGFFAALYFRLMVLNLTWDFFGGGVLS